MQQLRYPALSNITSQIGGSPPLPSIGGVAFASLAASLPLLQSKDLTTLATIKALATVALDLALEPMFVHSLSEAKELNQGRLQHLVNRFEQVSTEQQRRHLRTADFIVADWPHIARARY